MRKGFHVSGCDVEIASLINVVQKVVRHRPEFDKIRAQLQSSDQARGRFRPERSWIGAWLEPAGEKQLYLAGLEALAQHTDRANQCLEVAIVVVVADKQQAQFIAGAFQLLLEFSRQGLGVSKKKIPVETMVNGQSAHSGPALDFVGKRLAGRNRSVGSAHRPFGNLPLEPGIKP